MFSKSSVPALSGSFALKMALLTLFNAQMTDGGLLQIITLKKAFGINPCSANCVINHSNQPFNSKGGNH